MKIQFLSDLHLEHGPMSYTKNFQPHPDAEVLVLAGDITSAVNRDLVTRVFGGITHIPVLYVLGNHEYYRGKWPETKNVYKKFFEASGTNIQILDDDTFTSGGVTFIGSTMWSNPSYSAANQIQERISDFHVISGFSVEIMKTQHQKAVDFIRYSLQEARAKGNKSVVVTHFPPSLKAQEERFKGEANMLNQYFYTNMEEFILAEEPDLWIYGHTHGNIDFLIGKTYVVSNQQGYPGETTNKSFNVNRLIEV